MSRDGLILVGLFGTDLGQALGGRMHVTQLMFSTSLMIGLIACGSAGPSQSNPTPEPVAGASSTVSGQAIGWPQGRTGTFRAIVSRSDAAVASGFVFAVIAQGTIDAKGKLGLKLSAAPEPGFLKPYEVCGIKTAANALEADFDVAETGLEADASKRVALLAQADTTAQVSRVYLDRDLEVDGKCSDDGQVSAKLSLKKGWNLVLTSFTQPGRTGGVYSSATGVAGVPFEFKYKTW
jgi:hypothetical protein